MDLFSALKGLLPGQSDEAVNGVINDVRSEDPTAKDEDIVSAVQKQAPSVISNSYVTNKYGLGQRNELENQIAKENEGPNYGAALAAFGTGLAGGNAASAGQNFIASKKQDQAKRLADFDNKAGIEKNEMLASEENDPKSNASQLAQKLAVDMGIDPSLAQNLTAAKFKSLSPVLEKKYSIEQAKLGRDDAAENARLARADTAKARADSLDLAREDRIAREEERKAEREDKIANAKTEKDYALTTPFGLANSVDDAKKLKDASEAKSNFDNKIDQMIALREKHGGGAVLNREDVARGKQLSKDLLLEYKNMAKLGVLSKSDEDIINAIIPEDPLEYNSPLAAIQGQDPILARLKSFKSDSDKDFQNRVATRVRPGTQTTPAGMDVKPDQYAGAPKPGPKPGDIVKVKGKSYRVAEDGDNLEEIPHMAGN